MSGVVNFSAGPAMLPPAVLAQVQAELLDWRGTGMSVMEMSHRDRAFMSIAQDCEQRIREVLSVPPGYLVLFMQGGASAQFGVVPQNLLGDRRSADFVVTGAWGSKAAAEFSYFGQAHVAASGAAGHYTSIPDRADWDLRADAAYVHITTNETVHGVQFQTLPDVGEVPLVADMSSDIASYPLDVSRFGLIYAGAQKNIGPAGLTLVIVREDLIRPVLPGTLTVNRYATVAANDSMLNTPPCFAWYVCGLVFRWLQETGGLAARAQINRRKAALLYDYLDAQDFYQNPVVQSCRSLMNVPFTLARPELDQAFLDGAATAGLVGLKGHRLVGGMRASLYNAMPESGVRALLDYMKEFARSRA